MRILITGVTGFAGSHLAEALLHAGNTQLFGISRGTQWPEELAHLAEQVELLGCDLCDASATENVLRHVRPEQIYHLAGYAQTGRAFWDAEVVWTSNLTATRRLYESVTRWGGRPRILYVGSGMVYGNADDPERPQHEDSVLRPMSPYAVSKAAADLLSYQMTRDSGLDIVRVRPFNHIGPRQAPAYAVAHFAQQIAAIEAGQQGHTLETGNLQAWRDLTDVRDMVRAYMLLMSHGRTSEVYNAGSGIAVSMQSVLDLLLRLTRTPIEVRPQGEARRGSAPVMLRADIRKITQETGWMPTHGLEESVARILDYWRGRTGAPHLQLS